MMWKDTSIESNNKNFYIKQDLFRKVDIEINTSCNRRCSCCPNSIFDRGLIENEQLMPKELFYKIIDDLAEIDYAGMVCPHWFGEPLLDKRLVEFIDYIRKRLPRAYIAIFTNGDYLTFKRYIELVNVGVDEFCVTQHGSTTPLGIKDLKIHFESPKLFPVPVKYWVFDESTPLDNDGGLVDVQITNPVPCCLRYVPTIVINYEGYVVQCSTDYLKSNTFGHVKNEKIQDIWFSQPFKNHRMDIRKMEFRKPRCKKCVKDINLLEMKKGYIRARIEFFETADGETFLFDPIDLGKMVDIQNKTQFSVEIIEKDLCMQKLQPLLIIKGWAIDSQAGLPVSAIFIIFDTGQVFRAYLPVTRPDVAIYFKNENLEDSGFVAIISIDMLAPGKRTFRLKIVNHDKSGYYYPPEEFSFENTP